MKTVYFNFKADGNIFTYDLESDKPVISVQETFQDWVLITELEQSKFEIRSVFCAVHIYIPLSISCKFSNVVRLYIMFVIMSCSGFHW